MLFHAPLLGFLRGHHARQVHADVESEERCAHECLADEKCRSFQWKPPVSAQGSESGSVCALKRVAGAAAGLELGQPWQTQYRVYDKKAAGTRCECHGCSGVPVPPATTTPTTTTTTAGPCHDPLDGFEAPVAGFLRGHTLQHLQNDAGALTPAACAGKCLGHRRSHPAKPCAAFQWRESDKGCGLKLDAGSGSELLRAKLWQRQYRFYAVRAGGACATPPQG